MPVAAAIERTLQCVASRGVDSSVLTMTASTWFVGDAPRCATARLVRQRRDTASDKPRSPLADSRIRQPQLARDLTVGAAVTASQHNLRARRQLVGGLATCGPALQRRPVFGRQPQLRQRTASRFPNNPNITCTHVPTLAESSGTGH